MITIERRKRTDENYSIPFINEEEETFIIAQMASSGIPVHPWANYLCPILERRMLKCLEDFNQNILRNGTNGNNTKASNSNNVYSTGYESTMSENTSESILASGAEKSRDGGSISTAMRSLSKTKEELAELLRGFYNAPFTLQRICELILNPSAHYKSLDALCNGFEILLSVSSTIPMGTPEEVTRLQQEYKRVVSTNFPANNVSSLKRTDTVEMDIDS